MNGDYQNKVLHGDCLELMQDIPDSSVDMILCDPPYGSTKCSWDVIIPFEPLWEQYKRIIKPNGAIALFAVEPFTSEVVMSNIRNFRQKLTWLKTRPTNVFNAKKQFMNWSEDVVIFYKYAPTFNPIMRTDGKFSGGKVQRMNTDRSNGVMGKTGEKKDYAHKPNGGFFYPKTVLEFSNVNQHKNVHPTQKPVALCEYLIRTYTNEGETVLDNCAGSFTTAVACDNTNRNWICIEKEEKYCNIGLTRINDNRERLSLPLLNSINSRGDLIGEDD
jgi:site-specific DNA-methyltransferase (adenine-specific)